MKIVIIGSGNVAFHLCQAFTEAGLPLIQVFGRNREALEVIAQQNQISYSTEKLEDADCYIIAVKDDVVAEVSTLVTNPNALVVHTAGALPMEVLRGAYRKGVFYPLQTFSKGKSLDYTEIPFFIEAENDADLATLRHLALMISPKVMVANTEKRKHLHLAAVFACNFVNHLYARAKEITDQMQVPFDYLLPLIEETLDKVYYIEPKQAQTGPAIRNDQNTIMEHQKILMDDETKLNLYQTITQSIKKLYEL